LKKPGNLVLKNPFWHKKLEDWDSGCIFIVLFSMEKIHTFALIFLRKNPLFLLHLTLYFCHTSKHHSSRRLLSLTKTGNSPENGAERNCPTERTKTLKTAFFFFLSKKVKTSAKFLFLSKKNTENDIFRFKYKTNESATFFACRL
jgi:hypothetical protein